MKYRKAAIMEKFVEAYQWSFGGTKKAAREIFRKADPEYIKGVISAFDKQSFIAFYED